MKARGTKVVYEVLADIDGDGELGDGLKVFRFGSDRDAQAFAARETCYGQPAKVLRSEVSRQLARRWGF